MIKSEFHWRRSRACTVTAVEQHQLGAEGLAHVLLNIARDEGRKYRISWKVEKRINPSLVHEIALSEYGRVMSVPEIVEEMRQHAMRDAAELQKYSDQLLADWRRDNPKIVKVADQWFMDKDGLTQARAVHASVTVSERPLFNFGDGTVQDLEETSVRYYFSVSEGKRRDH
ncbi:MAG: hypothetical protein G3W58_22870 [Pantoea ananatis]|nr:hypothetical protein [Pantoea ananatis]